MSDNGSNAYSGIHLAVTIIMRENGRDAETAARLIQKRAADSGLTLGDIAAEIVQSQPPPDEPHTPARIAEYARWLDERESPFAHLGAAAAPATYSDTERRGYRPPACDECGRPRRVARWEAADEPPGSSTNGTRWVPVLRTCRHT